MKNLLVHKSYSQIFLLLVSSSNNLKIESQITKIFKGFISVNFIELLLQG